MTMAGQRRLSYETLFANRITQLKAEGRYRVFADLERRGLGLAATMIDENVFGTR